MSERETERSVPGKSTEPFAEELILAVDAQAVFETIGKFRGLRKETPEVWKALASRSGFYRRSMLENDPAYKQLISYTVFVSKGHIFVMKRLKAQAESRLRGLLSVGVGGHMNPVPETGWPGKRAIYRFKALVHANILREIREEVIMPWTPPLTFLGFLNDDETEVGRVHLGVVCLATLAQPLLAIRESDKMVGAWVPVNQLHDLGRFESWSSLLLSAIKLR
ncbi:MAG TPA: hypothetical protein GX510_06280 [Firmicutes bacterium]|nr:hypothetical protein [Candidatus Fermentithermobacillaceae bacterium]